MVLATVSTRNRRRIHSMVVVLRRQSERSGAPNQTRALHIFLGRHTHVLASTPRLFSQGSRRGWENVAPSSGRPEATPLPRLPPCPAAPLTGSIDMHSCAMNPGVPLIAGQISLISVRSGAGEPNYVAKVEMINARATRRAPLFQQQAANKSLKKQLNQKKLGLSYAYSQLSGPLVPSYNLQCDGRIHIPCTWSTL